MQYHKRSAIQLADLVTMPPDQYTKVWKEPNDNNLKALRKYHIKKLKEVDMEKDPSTITDKVAELLQRSGIDPTNIQRINRVNVWQAAKRGENDEWDVTDLVGVQLTPENENIEQFTPVEPARITPTKRKRVPSSSQLLLVYGDGQVGYRRIIDPVTDESKLVPLHNVPAHNIIQQLNARYRPQTTVNLGDFADMAEFSKFDPDSDHFHKTLGPAMRYIHDFYGQLVTDNPDAHHVEVDSNHATRVKKQVLRNLPSMHDFVRPGESYPMMTYYSLANLARLGIEFISGYGGAEFVYGEENGPPIVFKHGVNTSNIPGGTVRKEAQENPEVNVVRGHGHSDEHVSITTRSGRRLFYQQIGSSCINDGPVPGYHSAVDDHNQPVKYHNRRHQNTLAIIEDYGNGEYQVDIINVFKGVAHYRGEEFNGNEQGKHLRAVK